MKIGVTSEPLFKLNGPIAAVLIGLLLFGCLGAPASKANDDAVVLTNSIVQGEAMANQTASNQKTIANPIVTFVTTKGTFQAEIFQDRALITSSNFLRLVKSGFYNGLTFHRYVEKFVIQGGDPNGDGTGGSKDTIPLEIVPGLTHTKGALAMARTMDPNSASSQFYVALEDLPQLNGNYAVFGRVTSGMEIVLKLRQGDRMISVSTN